MIVGSFPVTYSFSSDKKKVIPFLNFLFLSDLQFQKKQRKRNPKIWIPLKTSKVLN